MSHAVHTTPKTIARALCAGPTRDAEFTVCTRAHRLLFIKYRAGDVFVLSLCTKFGDYWEIKFHELTWEPKQLVTDISIHNTQTREMHGR